MLYTLLTFYLCVVWTRIIVCVYASLVTVCIQISETLFIAAVVKAAVNK